MKIDVARLSEGREVEFFEEWDPKIFDLEAPGISYVGPLAVRAYVSKESGVVGVRVVLKANTTLTCSRCFKEFSSLLDKTLKMIYPLDKERKIFPVDGNIREELMLTYPQKILCQEDCKGLCIRCGADLNDEKCRCKV
ncbi:MAG: hypothetical protein AUJ74_04750 [Candidatus Omnitrophica bacterium CG1_02_44_16]|nr:MAG: hypothetical protein AUJ74_04750 [Candidatus Omnitrophica bacterium CG1_02_44_16]PIZ83278.1 MAG: hypothetical protein COX96_08525 [Candidatus Omnitrophica bacterium CG_4_10_14_0_2_um_filter_44_9]